MESDIEILPINPGSDGDGRKWPKHHYERNDEYFKERIASEKWIYDLPGGPQDGIVYRLDKMPHGYAGFQRQRPDSKHVDRYIYGHPNGQFRSLNEFYPHFKHLMDHGGPVGCTCKLCVDGSSKAKPKAGKSIPKTTTSRFDKATDEDEEVLEEPKNLISPYRPRAGQFDEPWRPKKRKLNDIEGVPDIYESFIQQLKDVGPEESINEPIHERMSPDWRVGNITSKEHVDQLLNLPKYAPRPGELVLFDIDLGYGELIAWDSKGETFKRQQIFSGTWLTQPEWRVGVITQIPTEQVSDQDLVTDDEKQKGVNESGFRIQLLSKPNDSNKSFSKQLKYLPLHCIRPFYLWQACLKGLPQEQWHPTMEHALTIASSFCVVERFRFRGVWPNATVFARGVYLGPELILVGDAVRLTPRPREQRTNNVTDVMVLTAIRLRFVNLDMEDDDMAPELPGLPYQTCLHFSGRVFTLDPSRSFDGVGKVPIDPESDILPPGLAAYGQWYHYSDPEQASARTELPYTRVLGRCVEGTAIAAWFKATSDKPLSSFQAVNSKAVVANPGGNLELTRGLQDIIDARIYSQKNDRRIKSQEGKSWFWADTRVEQLDLHEVNQLDVGAKNKERTKGQIAKWKAALKAVDGKKGAAEDYQAFKSKLKEQSKGYSSYGMMRAPASSTEPEQNVASGSGSGQLSGRDEEEDDDGDAMDVDDSGPSNVVMKQAPTPGSRRSGISSGSRSQSGSASGSGDGRLTAPSTVPHKHIETITLDDSDDDDVATNKMVGELSKNIRPNDARRGGN